MERKVHPRPPARCARRSLPAEFREKVLLGGVGASCVNWDPREADHGRHVERLGVVPCGSVHVDLPRPPRVRDVDRLDTPVGAWEKEAFRVQSSYEPVTELRGAQHRLLAESLRYHQRRRRRMPAATASRRRCLSSADSFVVIWSA